MSQTAIHQGQPIAEWGAALENAQAAMIMLHGRGATSASILSLAPEIHVEGFAYLAPQAVGNTWYPQSFLAPIAANEPYLTSALAAVANVFQGLAEKGIPSEKTLLLGFSQGACLALEFAARHARRYGGVIALTGGLIGPDGSPRNYQGSLEGTPIFIGASDVDAHVPLARVQESTRLLHDLGAEVTEKIYPNMGHTINQDEIQAVHRMMQTLISR